MRPPSPSTLPSLFPLLKASTPRTNLQIAQSLHAHITKSPPTLLLSNHLLNLYSKSSLRHAHDLFDQMRQTNLVSFSILISANSKRGDPETSLRLVSRVYRDNLVPNQFVLSATLGACSRMKSAGFGKQVHAQVVVLGFECDPFVKSCLVDMYSMFGDVDLSVLAFSRGLVRDSVVVNSMLFAYVKFSLFEEAIELFGEARRCYGFEPSEMSFVALVKACGCSENEVGKSVHGLIMKVGFDSNCFVGTSLVDMYGRFGEPESLEMVFWCVTSVDLPLYNALLVSLSQNGVFDVSFQYFDRLRLEGYSPDDCTFSSILKACSGLKSLSLGECLHGVVEKSKFRQDLTVNTTLINMYMKCGMIDQSLVVFSRMSQRNTILYNSVISGLIQNRRADAALCAFIHMNRNGFRSDLATFIVLMGIDSECVWLIYAQAIKLGFGQDVMVENALLDGLFKSCLCNEALEFFDKMEKRNVISWTTAISGLTQSGYHSKAMELFKNVNSTSVCPNNFTFSSALNACGRSAGLQQGQCIHCCSMKHGIVGDTFTRSSLLDMYAKCGALDDSRKLFEEMPKTDVILWNIMISSYAQHGYGQKALEQLRIMDMYGVEPNHTTFLSLLTACSHCGLIDDGVQLFESMVLNHNIIPLSEHYACMVDLYGRAGMLSEAKDFIRRMPLAADSSVWTVFLASCKLHGNAELAQVAEARVMEMESDDNPTLVLLSNMYSEVGKWGKAERMRAKITATGSNKEPGVSSLQGLRAPI